MVLIKEHTPGSNSGCGQYGSQTDHEAAPADNPPASLQESVGEGVDRESQSRLLETDLREEQAKTKVQDAKPCLEALHGKDNVKKS